jgi:hypothetical protein
MTRDPIEHDLRVCITTLFKKPPTPGQRRRLEQVLRQLADEQGRLADADERVGHRVRQATAQVTHQKTGRPRGSGDRFLRWEPPTRDRSGTLHISAALWHELGDPGRLDAQRYGGRVVLRSCEWPDGYAVSVPTGARGGNPRIRLGQEAADALRLTEGRVGALVEDRAIMAVYE